MTAIQDNIKSILSELPPNVQLVAAAKTRSVQEIREAVSAGIKVIGENYVQEVLPVFEAFGRSIRYHFIGHLQSNKVKKAVELFDMIETVDSEKLALEINKRSSQINKVMEVLIEVNSGRESQKFGVMPEDIETLISNLSPLSNIKIKGLMTMGPYTGDPEEARPYFQETKKCFDRIKSIHIPNVDMSVLSMGMTNSYTVAVQEGANVIRIGTKIFGPR